MTDRNALADKFIEWVERYAKKVCPEGCLPTPGQEREITLFADVTRALRQASIDASPRARSDFATGLEQASRNEAAAFAARRSATQPAPAAAPTLGREALAEALWRHEASGTPSSHRARCEQVFADQSETTKERWFGYADAALAALTAPDKGGPDRTSLQSSDLKFFGLEANEVGAQLILSRQPTRIESGELAELVARALARSVAGSDPWRTIESATKDETPRLLYFPAKGAIEGWWFASPKEIDDGWETVIGFIGEPTHWMPMSAGPVSTDSLLAKE